MSGNSEFAPIGNRRAASPMPQAGTAGKFQLQIEHIPKNRELFRRQIVRRVNVHAKQFFMRDMYGKVTNGDWLN